MKKRLSLFATLFALVFGYATPPPVVSQQDNRQGHVTPRDTEEAEQAAAVLKMLRNKLLTADPSEILEGEDAKARVFGALMEIALSEGVATVVSLRDGTASIYTSTGRGAIIGGYSAREQARSFVLTAEKHVARMKLTKEFPYPAVGHMKFYVLTRDGVYTADLAKEELVAGGHALSPLFRAANDVLTGLRAASERKKAAAK